MKKTLVMLIINDVQLSFMIAEILFKPHQNISMKVYCSFEVNEAKADKG